MVKIYLKGFARPISVIGEPVFEDERFYTIQSITGKKKILWENILYIEDFSKTDEGAGSAINTAIQQAIQQKQKSLKHGAIKETPKPEITDFTRVSQIEPEDEVSYDKTNLLDISIFLTGATEKSMTIKVPVSTMTGSYNPNLAREIFSNPQVQGIMGDFILSGVPRIDGNNVYFSTKSASEIKNKVNVLGNMLNGVTKASSESLKAGSVPSMSLDNTFNMPASPYERPVSFSA